MIHFSRYLFNFSAPQGIEAFLDFVDDDVPYYITHEEGLQVSPKVANSSCHSCCLDWWEASVHCAYRSLLRSSFDRQIFWRTSKWCLVLPRYCMETNDISLCLTKHFDGRQYSQAWSLLCLTLPDWHCLDSGHWRSCSPACQGRWRESHRPSCLYRPSFHPASGQTDGLNLTRSIVSGHRWDREKALYVYIYIFVIWTEPFHNFRHLQTKNILHPTLEHAGSAQPFCSHWSRKQRLSERALAVAALGAWGVRLELL